MTPDRGFSALRLAVPRLQAASEHGLVSEEAVLSGRCRLSTSEARGWEPISNAWSLFLDVPQEIASTLMEGLKLHYDIF